MTQTLEIQARRGVPVDAPDQSAGGFAAGTRIATSDGLRDVAELREGNQIRSMTGSLVRLIEVRVLPGTTLRVTLPSRDGAEPLTVAQTQLLLCKHFLCAALFGAPEVIFRAGDISGPGIQVERASGPALYGLGFAEPVFLRIGGYEFLSTRSVADFVWAGEGGRTGDGIDECERGPHPTRPEDVSSPVRAFLQAADVRQLCQSGILFRQVRRP